MTRRGTIIRGLLLLILLLLLGYLAFPLWWIIGARHDCQVAETIGAEVQNLFPPGTMIANYESWRQWFPGEPPPEHPDRPPLPPEWTTLYSWMHTWAEGLTAAPYGIELRNPGITDAHVRDAAKINRLRYIDLDDSQVSDAGLAVLANMQWLKSISVQNTRVTREAVSRFRKRSPSVRLFSDYDYQ